MLTAIVLTLSQAYAGCGALKPDSFGNRNWDNEGFRLTVENGVTTLAFMVRSAGVDDTPIVDAVVAIALEDGTMLERPAQKPAPAAAALWGGTLPVTMWWVPISVDAEVQAAVARSQIKAIKVTTPLRTTTMEYPSMAVVVISESTAGKVAAVRAKQVPEMVACLAN